MASITIKIYQYCAGGNCCDFEVPAMIVGDLAIHRPVFWFHNSEPKASTQGWTVTHIPSGLSVLRAMPDSYKTRKAIKAWAVEFQNRAASIFADLRTGNEVDRDTALSFWVTGKGVVIA